MSIEVSHLVKIYGVQRAVDDISFSIRKGEIVGFLGPNGAGKSTTMKVATCYIPPTEGSIKVAGYDVYTSAMEVRKRVGYLPEHNPLYLDMYVEEYLDFIGSLHQMKFSFRRKRLNMMIEICGLQLERGKKIGALSKGYRQRVGLAQAMIHDPEVLILDEPTTGLDPNQISEIRELIKQVGKEKTVVFSTHIMQEVQAICERVVIINRGKLVADHNVRDLKTMHSNFTILQLEFASEINGSELEKLPGVLRLTSLGNGKYELQVSGENDHRALIIKMSSDRQWPLLGLKQEEATLENIFKQLTENKSKG